MASDLSQVIRAAEREGWTVSSTKRGHVRFQRPGGPPVFTSSTPGDVRSTRNLVAQLKRAGLEGLRRRGS